MAAALNCEAFTIIRIDFYLNVCWVGAFAKLRKATISFVVSVCLSVRIDQLGSHWRDFHEILYFKICRKSVGKVQVLLKFDNNNGTLHEDLCTFMIVYR